MVTIRDVVFDYNTDPVLNSTGTNGISGAQSVSLVDDKMRLLMANTATAINTLEANIVVVKDALNSFMGSGSVTGTQLANRTITNVNVALRTLTGGENGVIAIDTIQEWNMAPESIGRRELQDDCVITAKIDNHQVTGGEVGGKIAEATITDWNMAPESVGEGNLKPDSVTGVKIKAAEVARGHFASGALPRPVTKTFNPGSANVRYVIPAGAVALDIEMWGGFTTHYHSSPPVIVGGRSYITGLTNAWKWFPVRGQMSVKGGGGSDDDVTASVSRDDTTLDYLPGQGAQPRELINNLAATTLLPGDYLRFTTQSAADEGIPSDVTLGVSVGNSRIVSGLNRSVIRNLAHGGVRITYWS